MTNHLIKLSENSILIAIGIKKNEIDSKDNNMVIKYLCKSKHKII